MDGKIKKLIESLIEIEGQLDNAYYSLPEYDANSDTLTINHPPEILYKFLDRYMQDFVQ